jgi:hypothetical protein
MGFFQTSKQDLTKCNEYEQIEFEPFDPRNKYTKGRLRDKGGNIFEIMKGAPHVLLDKAWNKVRASHSLTMECESFIDDA